MAAIDFFCSPEDRHRVILLVDLLEKAGQSVVLRTEPQDEPTRPCLVACTRRAFREPWICDLFTRARQVAALRLDDAPLPGPAAEIIDMQSWPARSADRHVGSLVGWLQDGAVRSGFSGGAMAGSGAGSRRSGEARQRQRPAGSALQRVRARLADPNLPGLVMLVGVLGAAAVLLWTIDPDQRIASPEPAVATLRMGDALVDDLALDSGTSASGTDTPWSAGTITASGGRDAVTPVASPEPEAPLGSSAAPEAAAADPIAVPGTGALHHLCDPRALAAARAWSAVLNWTAATPPFDRACGGPA